VLLLRQLDLKLPLVANHFSTQYSDSAVTHFRVLFIIITILMCHVHTLQVLGLRMFVSECTDIEFCILCLLSETFKYFNVSSIGVTVWTDVENCWLLYIPFVWTRGIGAIDCDRCPENWNSTIKSWQHCPQISENLACERTRSSAIAEGPRDASCQLKSCQLPHNSAETTCTTSPEPSISRR